MGTLVINELICIKKLSFRSISRSYHFKFFKGCLPQILLDPFLNALTQILQVAVLLSSFERMPF